MDHAIRTMECDMSEFLATCVERYRALVPTAKLHWVSTPCVTEDDAVRWREEGGAGLRQPVLDGSVSKIGAQVLMKILYAA